MKRVFRPGIFDLFHIGHLNCIKEASKYGDELIIGVQDDRVVEENKGVKPTIPLAHRIQILSHLKRVNRVISYKGSNLSPILKRMKINVLAVGEDYGLGDEFPDQKLTVQYCYENGIEIVRTSRTIGISSSSIKESVESFWKNRKCDSDKPIESSTMLGSCNEDKEKLELETKEEVDYIKGLTDEEDTVLDLGCGYGRLAIPLADHVSKIFAVDFSEEFINYLKSKEIAKIEAHCGDVINFDVGKKFDCIIMSGLFPCIDDEQVHKVMEASRKHLNKNGRIIVRASVGVEERINVINQYSEKLNSFYTAFYRTEDQLDKIMSIHGMSKVNSKKMYQNHADTKIIMASYLLRPPIES